MQFAGADHECNLNACFDETIQTGNMVERHGTCAECDRRIVEQYDLARLQDPETGEFVEFGD